VSHSSLLFNFFLSYLYQFLKYNSQQAPTSGKSFLPLYVYNGYIIEFNQLVCINEKKVIGMLLAKYTYKNKYNETLFFWVKQPIKGQGLPNDS
jgi:hypothetical protein